MIPKLPSGIGGRVLAFLSEWFDTPLHRQIVNPRNLSRGITRLALVDCVEDLPGELLADFIAWATDGGVVRYGGTDILESIHQASCPALFIAGAADRIGPVAAVKAAYEAWGTESASIAKSFVVLGREAGTVDDYGHGDLAMGTRLDEELHPKIEAFLAEPEPN
jgi:pimeloyl-ACP methyl ester carboxylesterase